MLVNALLTALGSNRPSFRLAAVVLPLLVFLKTTSLPAQTVEVRISGIHDATGEVRAALFNNEADFTKKPVMGEITKSMKGEVTITFSNVPVGEYAISVYHDANENGRLDKNFIGIPKEGFGFSNNAMGKFGPPSFEACKIPLGNGNKVVAITLNYL